MEIKQVIVVRSDLSWGKGKLATHVAHAALSGMREALRWDPAVVRQWEESGEKKIVVKIPSESELLSLYERAKRSLPAVVITDAGYTQLSPGTVTALALGPWYAQSIDVFTRNLKLL